VIQGDAEFDQIQVKDWDKAKEDEATIEDDEVIRVQREIKRRQQKQVSIMRRQATAQRVEA
jgi:hypothetical protein